MTLLYNLQKLPQAKPQSLENYPNEQAVPHHLPPRHMNLVFLLLRLNSHRH